MAVALLVSLYSCTHDGIELYDGPKSGIYIQQVATTDVNGNPLSFTDSLSFSFAGYEASHVEHPVRFHVCTMGRISQQDRPYVLKFIPEISTAVEGEDFDMFRNDFLVHAGQVGDTVIVTVKRTPRLRKEKIVLRFRLEPNDYFSLPIDSFKNSTNWSSTAPNLPATSFTISVSETYKSPFMWRFFAVDYFGEFTVSKMLELEKVMGWTYSDWQSAPNNRIAQGKLGFAANLFKKHLQALADAGTPVLDDDGSYMQLAGDYLIDYTRYE